MFITPFLAEPGGMVVGTGIIRREGDMDMLNALPTFAPSGEMMVECLGSRFLVRYWVRFEVLTLTLKALSDQGPPYLLDHHLPYVSWTMLLSQD